MEQLRRFPSLWAILPEELTRLEQAYQAYSRKEHVPKAGLFDVDLDKIPQTFFMDGDIAVMQIDGIITPKADFFSQLFGGSSIDVMTRDLKALVDNDDVASIVLDIDSPGGVVFGIQEFAKMVFAARERKPVFAITSSMMASAAMWIGAAAERVFITSETAITGSIGVVVNHIDISGLEGKLGIKTTEIASGKFKRIASSFAPLTEEGRAELQSQVDHIYAAFVADVAKFRGVSEETVRSDMADGKLFIGSMGLKAGLVDGLKSMEGVINSIKEVARIKEVKAQLSPGHEALIQKFVADGKTTGQEAAIAVIKAMNENRARGRENTTPSAETFEEKLQRDWKSDPALRAEFGNYETYRGYFTWEEEKKIKK